MIKKILCMYALVFCIFNAANSQVSSVTNSITNPVTNNYSYWQFSTRVGYDFARYVEKMPYIKHIGGPMFGVSVNRYWHRWGVQTDFDWIRNNPKSTYGKQVDFIDTPFVLTKLNVKTQKDPITRMFLGIGPSYKYQTPNNKWSFEAALLGGVGYINGGEILVEGLKTTGPTPKTLLTYHSGFDKVFKFAVKGQIRANYWFKPRWGLNFGAYYLDQFNVQSSKQNSKLVSNGYLPAGSPLGLYYYQIKEANFQVPIGGVNSAFSNDPAPITQKIDGDPFKIRVKSVGLFIGLSYKLVPLAKENKKEKYCLQVTAKDKYTGELIPNTDVAIKNGKGVIVQTAKTDAFGNVKFCDIKADDYKINGIYNDIALEGSSTNKNEFKKGEVLQKEIFYADRSFIVKGRAVECNTTKGIAGLNVIAENNTLAIKKSTLTDANGNFSLTIPEKGEFNLYGKKDSFYSQTEIVNASNYNRDKTLFVKIEICAEKVDCGKAIALKNILFDLDKYFIRPDAKPELNKLVQFLKDYPTVSIELGSHTDCRSSAEYNQTLSQNRANASADYLVSQGIVRNRITAVGYGEAVLLNECADGVNCTEAQHQINRRTEFKVICPK